MLVVARDLLHRVPSGYGGLLVVRRRGRAGGGVQPGGDRRPDRAREAVVGVELPVSAGTAGVLAVAGSVAVV